MSNKSATKRAATPDGSAPAGQRRPDRPAQGLPQARRPHREAVTCPDWCDVLPGDDHGFDALRDDPWRLVRSHGGMSTEITLSGGLGVDAYLAQDDVIELDPALRLNRQRAMVHVLEVELTAVEARLLAETLLELAQAADAANEAVDAS